MENKFNFNSQICTTREQSERLLALGLKMETADMILSEFDDGSWRPVTLFIEEPNDYDASLYPEFETIDIPAWSLHRLIEIAGNMYEVQPWLGFKIKKDYDLIIDHIQWLIECNQFNKEYLVQYFGKNLPR